jgi:hypothetical protein
MTRDHDPNRRHKSQTLAPRPARTNIGAVRSTARRRTRPRESRKRDGAEDTPRAKVMPNRICLTQEARCRVEVMVRPLRQSHRSVMRAAGLSLIGW